MSWRLFLHDPALRGPLLLSGLVGAVALLVLLDLGPPSELGTRPLARIPGGSVPLFMMFWLLFGLVLTTAAFWRRSSRIGMALPVSARRLWTVRTAAVLVSCVAAVAVSVLVFAVDAAGDGMRWALASGTIRFGALVAATLVLLVALLQLPLPELGQIPLSMEYITYGALMAFLTFLWAAAVPATAITIGGSLGLALVLLAYRASTLPVGFVLAAREVQYEIGPPVGVRPTAAPNASSALPAASEGPERAEVNGRVTLYVTLLRTLVLHSFNWFNVPAAFLWGVIIADAWATGRNPLPAMALLAVWWYSALHTGIARLHRLTHLPIPARRACDWIVLPIAALALLGSLAYFLWNVVAPGSPGLVRLRGGVVLAPTEFQGLATVGDDPVLASPWGEVAVSHPVRIPFSRRTVFDPFESSPQSSAAFLDLQLVRALEAVHGVPPDDTGVDGAFRDRSRRERHGLTVPWSRGRRSTAHDRTFALTTLIATTLFSGLSVVSLFQYTGGKGRKLVSRITVAVVVMLTGIIGISLLSNSAGTTTWTKLGGVPIVLLRHLAERVNVGAGTLWLLTCLVAVAAYGLFQRQFRRVELPHRRPSPFVEDY